MLVGKSCKKTRGKSFSQEDEIKSMLCADKFCHQNHNDDGQQQGEQRQDWHETPVGTSEHAFIAM